MSIFSALGLKLGINDCNCLCLINTIRKLQHNHITPTLLREYRLLFHGCSKPIRVGFQCSTYKRMITRQLLDFFEKEFMCIYVIEFIELLPPSSTPNRRAMIWRPMAPESIIKNPYIENSGTETYQCGIILYIKRRPRRPAWYQFYLHQLQQPC